MELIKNINWNFLKYTPFWLSISGLLIIISIVSLIIHNGPRYGIDFTGGRVLEVSFGSAPDIAKIRSVLANKDFDAIEVQSVKKRPWVMFRVPISLDEQYKDFSQDMMELLRNNFTEEDGYKLEILSNDKVGPKVGQELRKKALWALLFSLIAMLIYITIRFQFRFGAGSIIALFHDTLITIGFFSVFDKEITLSIVAALLTIVGYSINDSIVVSDRVRENMGKLRRMNFYDLVNRSLNEVFSRTIITSFTVWITCWCLIIWGGEVIRDFALALLVGITVGTYSSVYIVTPLVVQWEKWFPKKVAAVTRAK